MGGISETGSRLVHVWQRCHGCAAAPIVGRRFDCVTCPAGPDNHLCGTCFEALQRGRLHHPARGSYATCLATTDHRFCEKVGVAAETLEPWLAVPDRPPSTPPRVPDGFVVRPEFRSGRDSFLGSCAFVLAGRPAGPFVVVTALHVLDELIKRRGIDCTPINLQYTGRELARAIDYVCLYNAFAVHWMLAPVGKGTWTLPLPDARLGDDEPRCQRDLAAFLAAPGSQLSAGRLGDELPDVGAPIWLAVNTGPVKRGRVVPAVVVERTEATFIYRVATGLDRPGHTSGAPLLNTDGDVVGVNVGGGVLAGRLYGHGSHAGSIRGHLAPYDVLA